MNVPRPIFAQHLTSEANRQLAATPRGHVRIVRADQERVVRKPSSDEPTVTDPEAADEPASKRKGLTLRLNKAAWRQLNELALDDDRHAHELLIAALNDYFAKRGKPRIA